MAKDCNSFYFTSLIIKFFVKKLRIKFLINISFVKDAVLPSPLKFKGCKQYSQASKIVFGFLDNKNHTGCLNSICSNWNCSNRSFLNSSCLNCNCSNCNCSNCDCLNCDCSNCNCSNCSCLICNCLKNRSKFNQIGSGGTWSFSCSNIISFTFSIYHIFILWKKGIGMGCNNGLRVS